jgi:serine/threonine-protein kinase
MIGERLGPYEIEELLGEGGMGVVYRPHDTFLKRPVAIKVIAPHAAGEAAARSRLLREARLA